MGNDKIKSENRKALPKFILLMAVAVAVGFAGGYLASKYGLNTLRDGIKGVGRFFGTYIAPALMTAVAVILPSVCIPMYRDAKKRIDSWDGEDEETYGIIDKKLSVVLWMTNTAFIFACFLLAASYTGGFSIFEGRETTVLFFLAVFAMLCIIAETILITQKCVDATKRINPEKDGSVYDTDFEKKWMESMDEAEKLLVGKCAYKAYTATGKVCAILSLLLAMGALIFDIGFLPSLAVCVVWLVAQTVYNREAIKYSGGKNKLSR